MENGYYSIITQHGCSGREVYRITVKEFSKSFLKIISYNEETGELKARFRVHYQMDEAEKSLIQILHLKYYLRMA